MFEHRNVVVAVPVPASQQIKTSNVMTSPVHLDEFVFRFNRRRTRDAAFSSLLGIAAAQRPVTYKMLLSQAAAA